MLSATDMRRYVKLAPRVAASISTNEATVALVIRGEVEDAGRCLQLVIGRHRLGLGGKSAERRGATLGIYWVPKRYPIAIRKPHYFASSSRRSAASERASTSPNGTCSSSASTSSIALVSAVPLIGICTLRPVV
jgi:hypothetical protein